MDKKRFRKECIKKLKKSKINSFYADKRVSKELYNIIKKSEANVIMLYIPLKIEINISNLIMKLRREKKRLFVPFMVGKSFRLVKYRLPIKIKKFGVKEPNISNYFEKRIDLAIVPVIGIDVTFRRVGFGQGFYDRFFENSRDKIAKIIFVSRKKCLSSNIVTDDYDVEGNIYITPQKILDKRVIKNRLIRN